MIHIRTIPKPYGILFPGIQLQMMTREVAEQARRFEGRRRFAIRHDPPKLERTEFRRIKPVAISTLPSNVSQLSKSERKRLVLNRMRVR